MENREVPGEPSEGPRSAMQVFLVMALILAVTFGLLGVVGLTVFAKTDDALLALISVVIFAFSLVGVMVLVLFTSGRLRKIAAALAANSRTPKR